jgi:hypothetical protein
MMFPISDWLSLNFNSVTDHTPKPQSHEFRGTDSRNAALNLQMLPQGAFCLQQGKCKKHPKTVLVTRLTLHCNLQQHMSVRGTLTDRPNSQPCNQLTGSVQQGPS